MLQKITENGAVVQTYQGSRGSFTFTSTTTQVHLHFLSDGSQTRAGFTSTFYSVSLCRYFADMIIKSFKFWMNMQYFDHMMEVVAGGDVWRLKVLPLQSSQTWACSEERKKKFYMILELSFFKLYFWSWENH